MMKNNCTLIYSSFLFTLLLSICSLPVVAQTYCVPQTYYGFYHGYMQYQSFSTSGGMTNIDFAPGGYPHPIQASNSYPEICCNTSNEGYAYITTTQCSGTLGATINFSILNSANYYMWYMIWVDWNHNGSFSDPGEAVYTPATYFAKYNGVIDGSFSIPQNASLGVTRLRIASVYSYYQYGSQPEPCQTWDSSGQYYGGFTDFNFIVSVPSAGNSSTAATSADSIAETSVYKAPMIEQIHLYPNPATSTIHIESSENVNVIISSMEGRDIINTKNARDIDISKLVTGVYMVHIYNPAGTLLKIEKLVKIR